MIQIPADGGNPFAVLSFIVAPAILTNASSVLAMSTSNRLARVVDRARDLSKQLEASTDEDSPETDRRLRDLGGVEYRSLLLIQALRSFYLALGGFASAALLSLLGAVIISLGISDVVIAFEVVAALAGVMAVGALVHGSVMLVRETRLAVQSVRARADSVRARIARLRR